jgi:hypothetical protein
MKLDIYAGKRVLYKHNGQWAAGTILDGTALINKEGLLIPVIPTKQANECVMYIDINDIFLDAVPLDEWTKQYKEYFMTKDEYIQLIEAEDFEKNLEEAYVSDGEYIYYPVNKYNKTWITKQPFDYIVRGNI